MAEYLPLIELTADPAANNEISYTATQFIVVKFFAASLVTDANAANRRVAVTVDDGTTVFFKTPSLSDQAASLTYLYGGWDGSDPAAVAALSVILGWPVGGVMMAPGYRLKTITTNRQATDNWGAGVLHVQGAERA